jgi:hypothetical protein
MTQTADIHPLITIDDMARVLCVSISTVRRRLPVMMADGLEEVTVQTSGGVKLIKGRRFTWESFKQFIRGIDE